MGSDTAHIDPEVWQRVDVRQALARRDVTTLFRLLTQAGYSQRRIARFTRLSQSQVSEIVHGRRVMAYDVLVRVADGLGVERGWMGLAHDEGSAHAYAGSLKAPLSSTAEEVDEDVKRRAFLTAAAAAVCGRPVLGEVLELPTAPDTPTPLPSRLGSSDVDVIVDLTSRFRALDRTFGGSPAMVGEAARRGERLLAVPATESVRQRLLVALADLRSLAGWAAFDQHADDLARGHFTRGAKLAKAGNDERLMAAVLFNAGRLDQQRGAPNDALKLFQLSQVALSGAKGEPGVSADKRTWASPPDSTWSCWLHGQCALALAETDHPDAARRELAVARQARVTAGGSDMETDGLEAEVELLLGRLDVAGLLAGSAVRAGEGTANRRQLVFERITQVTVHVRAGERDGGPLAEQVIRDVSSLNSGIARDRLVPLAEALSARRDVRSRELAVAARRGATAR